MKLRAQLIALIIALLFLQLIGVTYLNIINARLSLHEQLLTNSQNTADSLGISLRKLAIADDTAGIISITRALFDHGDYQRIAVIRRDGSEIADFNIEKLEIDKVPGWFYHLIKLDPPTATSNLSAGWKIIGKIHVKASPDYIYINLWRSITRSFLLLVGATIAIAILLLGLLHIILKPVYRTKDQAEAIILGDFPIQKQIPFTYEFKIVVDAMNRMAKRLSIVFARHATMSRKLQEKAYKDPLTGFSNKDYFELRMDYLLSMRGEYIYGSFMYMTLKTDDTIDDDYALKLFSELIERDIDTSFGGFGARLNDTTLCAMLPFTNLTTAKHHADTWLSSLEAEFKQHGQCHIGVLGFNGYWHNETIDIILTDAKQAQEKAQAQQHYAYHAQTYHQHKDIDLEKIVLEHIDAQSFELDTVNIESASDELKILHQEVVLAIQTNDTRIRTGRGFTAIARRNHQAVEYDKIIIRTILENLKTQKHSHRLSFAISEQSLQDQPFHQWLQQIFNDYREQLPYFILEVAEYHAIYQFDQVKQLATFVKQFNVQFGLMRVGREFTGFDHFRSLPIDYILINGTYIRNIHLHSENQAFVRELVYVCHSLEINVMAEHVTLDEEKATLQQLGVDGLKIEKES